MQDLGRLYRLADEVTRRRLNRCLFAKVLVDAERPIAAELAEPPAPDWARPYVDGLKKAVPAVEGALALNLLEAENPALVSVGPGSNIVTLVDQSGFEPPTSPVRGVRSTN